MIEPTAAAAMPSENDTLDLGKSIGWIEGGSIQYENMSSIR